MSISYKLTPQKISSSYEINNWLEQFSDSRTLAIDLLCQLKIIPTDSVISWLKKEITSFKDDKCALYALRKITERNQDEEKDENIWEPDGEISRRPGRSIGSGELIYALINSLTRVKDSGFFDNPSINILRKKKIHNIFIIDDIIASGGRASDYLKVFFKNSTIKSWWSYGLLKIYFFAYTISEDAKEKITSIVPGDNYHSRKFKLSEKLHFISHDIYKKDDKRRWGDNLKSIEDFCKSNDTSRMALGYQETMANILFYHSVPNNIPGCLWTGKKVKPLFPGRIVPDWMISLLENDTNTSNTSAVCAEQLQILQLIKRGVKSANSLSKYLELDISIVEEYLGILRCSGFIDERNFITQVGCDVLFNHTSPCIFPDFSLYIPKKWCAV